MRLQLFKPTRFEQIWSQVEADQNLKSKLKNEVKALYEDLKAHFREQFNNTPKELMPYYITALAEAISSGISSDQQAIAKHLVDPQRLTANMVLSTIAHIDPARKGNHPFVLNLNKQVDDFLSVVVSAADTKTAFSNASQPAIHAFHHDADQAIQSHLQTYLRVSNDGQELSIGRPEYLTNTLECYVDMELACEYKA